LHLAFSLCLFLLLVMGWIIGLWRGGNSCPSVVRRDAHWRGWNATMLLACLILRVAVPSLFACCLVTPLTVAVICSSRERHHAALQETRNTMRMERKAEAREQISIQHAVASVWVGVSAVPCTIRRDDVTWASPLTRLPSSYLHIARAHAHPRLAHYP